MKLVGPIIKKELELKSRGYSFPAVIAVMVSLLFIISLVCCFAVVAVMRETHEFLYGMFPDIYILVSMLAYALLLLTAPMFTAASISGERETGTYDLLLTTRLMPHEIVLEKLAYALVRMCINAVTCLPAILVPLMFGGVGFIDAVILLIVFLPGIYMVLAAGIFASSVSYSSARSIATAYGIEAGMTAGMFLVPLLMKGFAMEGNNGFAYLILADPVFTVLTVLRGQTGGTGFVQEVFASLGLGAAQGIINHAALIACIVQTAIGTGFVLAASYNAAPGRLAEKDIKRKKVL